MAIIKKLNGHTPKFGKNCFLADNAAIIGDVEMGNDCSIWFGAVLRGDVHSIRIGNKVNIQDNATIHATYKKSHDQKSTLSYTNSELKQSGSSTVT